jgi:TonB-linked SusC/RagA family outer membrane protein
MKQTFVMLAALVTLGMFAAAPLTAQQGGVVRGTIVDAGSMRPLSGVQVSVPSTGQGSLTNAAGEFTLVGIAPGVRAIRVDMIGYKTIERTVTIATAQTAIANFELAQTALALDELVVTGTAGAVSKRTVGNAVTKIDVTDIIGKTTVTNVADVLAARTPGLTLLANAGTPGAAPDIKIRGASSFLGNRPVIYVDGVRIKADDLGTFTPSGAGATSYQGQQTSAFNLISPQDIESIEVIKGPAASTLYGSDAAGGVIQIITKKGARGAQPLRFDIRSELASNDWEAEIPTNYTVCTTAKIAEVDAAQNPVWPGCQGRTAGSVISDNPLTRDPLAINTGAVRSLGITARGGSDRFAYYVSANTDNVDGVFLNSWDDRRSVRANFSAAPSGKIDFNINSSFVHNFVRLPVGDESAQGLILSALRGRPGRAPANNDPLREGWATTTPAMANEYNNTTKSDKFTVSTTVNIRPMEWFRHRFTVGLDYTSSLAQILSPPGSVDADYAGVSGGTVAQRQPRTYNYTIDYAGNVDYRISSKVLTTTSVGVQAQSERREQLNATGTGFGAEAVTLIGSAATTVGSNSYSETKSLGYFIQEQIGLNDRLYLTGALRADDHSAFGTNFDVLVYPKASLSWIMSEEPGLASFFERIKVNNFKLRSAWGEAGKAPPPFSATQTYTVNKAAMGETIVSALQTNAYGNADLKAERGSEWEVGFDAGILNDKAGLELTYYHKVMNDVIASASAAPSTGFGGTFFGGTSAFRRNLGKIRNSGFEASLFAMPVGNRNVAWESRVTFAANSNELVDFGDQRVREPVSGQSYGTTQYHVEGYPIAGYWAYNIQRNPDGTPKLDELNRVVMTDTMQYIGSPAPTREVGFSNTIAFRRNLRLYVLFDYKGGAYVFNSREYQRCYVASQRNCARLANPSNVDLVTGDRKTDEVLVWTTAGRANNTNQAPYAPWIMKTDFVKLRDLSLSYMLPTPWAHKFRATAATLTVAGHNLATFTDYEGWDPEANSYNGQVYAGSGFARADIYSPPQFRRMSASLTLSF